MTDPTTGPTTDPTTGPTAGTNRAADSTAGYAHRVLGSDVLADGPVIRLRRDQVTMPGGRSAFRDVIEHPGAVAVVALDDKDRILLIQQYRHPVRRQLWELPAGLLDVAGEPAATAAARELAEEAGLTAGRWHTLVDVLTSPGMSDEASRVYLARDVRPVPPEDRYVGYDEEAGLRTAWLPLAEAAGQVLRGELENSLACVGVLAAAHARRDGFAGLRPPEAPWAAHDVPGRRLAGDT